MFLALSHQEDKYECPFCKQKDKFQPSVTSRHIRIHLCRHHQPYKCRYPSCSYACTRNTAISNHHKIHMPGVRICSVEHCHRQFTGPMSLRHHLQEAHNVAYPPAATTTGFVDTYRSVETISKRKRGGTDERSGMKRGRKKACAKSHNPAATVPPSNPVLVSPLPPLAQYSTGTPEWSLPPPPVSPSTSTSTHVPPSCRTARDIPGCPYAEVSGEHNSEEHKFSHPIPSSSLSKSCPNEPGAVSEFSAESGVTWNWSKLKASNTEYNGDLVWCPSRPIHPAPAYWGYWFPFYPQA
ncbi:hypothetical protein BDW22DRAFT_614643 [Trametopsis cervina]|nr:hypothetical protein BDW22DRAFT_614643 [Trametopsis cervina]